MNKNALLPLAGATLALFTSGCRPKPIPIKPTATVVVDNNKEKIRIEVETDPNIDLYASGGGVDTASSSLPYGTPNLTYPGSSYSSKVKSDAKGKATLILPIWADSAVEKSISVYGDSQVKRPIGKPKYRYGNATVMAKRSPRILFNPTTREVSCIGKPCTGTINTTTFRLDFRDIEAGAMVDLAGSKARSQGRTLAVTPDLTAFYNQVKVAEVFKEYPVDEFEVPMAVEFQDGGKLSTKLKFPASALKFPMGTSLGAVARGPVRFTGESDGPSADKSIFVSGYKPRVFGSAERAKDIDLVAVVNEERSNPSCGTYVGQTTGTRRTIDRSLTSANVSVFERRSGKKRSARRFGARDPGCPGTTWTGSPLVGTYDDAEVETWIKSFLK